MHIVSQKQAIVLLKVGKHPPKYKDKSAVIRTITYNNTAHCISMHIYICVKIFVRKYTCNPQNTTCCVNVFHVYMRTYINMHMNMCVYVHIYCMHTCIPNHRYIYSYIHVYIHIHIYTHMHTCICVYRCVYVYCMHTYMPYKQMACFQS